VEVRDAMRRDGLGNGSYCVMVIIFGAFDA